MATVDVHLGAAFPIRAPVEAAVAAFSDPAVMGAQVAEAARYEVIDGTTLDVTLKRFEHLGFSFEGRYRCTYVRDGATVRWTPVNPGSMRSWGTARFTPTAGGCRLDYDGHLSLELPVPRLVAAAITAVASRLTRQGMVQYVERMVAHIERTTTA